nr:MAG TPA_asm: hypothetical protein [Caudoviricetes sp.]
MYLRLPWVSSILIGIIPLKSLIIKSFYSCREQGGEYFTPLGWANAHPLRCVLF